MGILDALKKRSSAVRFSFSFSLHLLSPWPSSGKAIAIAWQRGSKKKKRGVTEAHPPKQVQGQLGTVIEFNEVIQISATLYMEANASPTPNGPFKKKCLILAIVETADFAAMQSETKKEFPVACNRNIAAAVGEPSLSITVKCMWKSTGGPASMASSMSSDRTGGTFTTNFNAFIRGNENEKIPARLTGEQFDDLRGFDRLNTINESEHDYSLRSQRRSSRGSSHLRTQESSGFHLDDFVPNTTIEHPLKETIKEEKSQHLSKAALKTHERQASLTSEAPSSEFKFVADSAVQRTDRVEDVSAGQDRTDAWLSGLDAGMLPESPTTGLVYQLSDDMPIPPEVQQELQAQENSPDLTTRQSAIEREQDKDGVDSLSSVSNRLDRLSDNISDDILSSTEFIGPTNDANDSKSDERRLDTRLHSYTSTTQQKLTPTEGSREETKPRHSVEKRWKRTAQPLEKVSVSSELNRSVSPKRIPLSGRKQATTSPDRAPSPLSGASAPRDVNSATTTLLSELRSATFLEYSVYLARPGPQKYTSRNVLAPARRIAREVTSLEYGGEECIALLQSSLQAIRAMVEACGADIPGMSFWWGNCYQLRLLLLRNEGREVLCSSSPDPSDWSFRRMQQLILKIEKNIFDRLQQYLWWKIFIPHVISANLDVKPSPYNEGGVQKWIAALNAVFEQFSLPNANAEGELGHLHLLRRKIIGNCCRMMDSLLFRELLSAATQGELFFDSMDSFQADLIGSQPRSWPKVHLSALPFKKGPLTFGVGMHLKMAVSRWSEWAIEVNVKEPHHLGDPGQSLFPSLKASADLLMMPKELLTDASVRGELFAALSIRSMCILLEKFQPDEFAPDPVNPNVLQSLSERLNEIDDGGISLTLSEPPFEGKYDTGEYDSDMDVTFDSESEAEMDVIIKSFPPSESAAVSRFEILKNQWRTHTDKR